jgi:hypothetical protein
LNLLKNSFCLCSWRFSDLSRLVTRRFVFRFAELELLICSVAFAMAMAVDSVALTVSMAFILDLRMLAAVICLCLLVWTSHRSIIVIRRIWWKLIKISRIRVF